MTLQLTRIAAAASTALLLQLPAQEAPRPATQSPEAAQQAPKASKKAAPNAATLYRKAIAELRKALPDEEYEGDILLPEDSIGDAPEYTSSEWREAVKKSAVAISLFEQATQIDACRFDGKTKDLMSEFGQSLHELLSLRHVVQAQAWQRVSTDPRSAGVTAIRLMRHANHCVADSTMIGVAFGLDAEKQGIKLLKMVTKRLAPRNGQKDDDGKAVAKLFAKQLQQHQAARTDRKRLADIAEREFAWIMLAGLDELPKTLATKSAIKRATQIVRDMVEPLRKNPKITAKALDKHCTKETERLRALIGKDKLKTVLEKGVGEPLAAALVLICSPNVAGILEPLLEVAEGLESCRADLQKLASS